MGQVVFLTVACVYVGLSAKDRSYSLAGAAVLLPFNQYIPSVGLPMANVHSLIILVLLWGILRTPRAPVGRFVQRAPLSLALLAGLISISYVQTVLVEGNSGRLFGHLKEVLSVLFFCYAAFRIADRTEVVRRAFWGAVLGTGAEVSFCFLEALSRGWRVSGHFGERNTLGAFLATYIALYFGAYLASRARSFPHHWVLPYLAIAGTVATLGTRSRGAVLALGGTLLLVSLWKSRLIFGALLVSAFLYQTWMPQVVLDRFEEAVEESGGEVELAGTVASRIMIWKAGLRTSARHPFGVGFRRFGEVVGRENPETLGGRGGRDAHNEFVLFVVECGMQGLLVYMWLLAVLASRCWRTYKTDQDPVVRAMALGTLASLTAALSANMALTLLLRADITGVVWLLTGICARRAPENEAALRRGEHGSAEANKSSRKPYMLERPQQHFR